MRDSSPAGLVTAEETVGMLLLVGEEGCAGDRRQASWLGLGRNGDRRRDAPGRGAALDLGNRDGSQGDVLKYLPSRNFVSSYWARSAQNENLGANSSI
jgi:hypothetical protein